MASGGVFLAPHGIAGYRGICNAEPEASGHGTRLDGAKTLEPQRLRPWQALKSFFRGALSRAVGRKRSMRDDASEDDFLQSLEEDSPGSPRAKRPRTSARVSLVPGTPALSPLGSSFTPVARGRSKAARDDDCGPAAHALLEDSEPDSVPRITSSGEFWRVQLEAIYRKRNPYKLCKVPALLAKYEGHEIILYKKVCLTYDLDPNRFYAELACWEEDEEADDSDDEAEKEVAPGTQQMILHDSNDCLGPRTQVQTRRTGLCQVRTRIGGGSWLPVYDLSEEETERTELEPKLRGHQAEETLTRRRIVHAKRRGGGKTAEGVGC